MRPRTKDLTESFSRALSGQADDLASLTDEEVGAIATAALRAAGHAVDPSTAAVGLAGEAPGPVMDALIRHVEQLAVAAGRGRLEP